MWTSRQDAKLLRLWDEHSAAQIAAQLGKTRNAVMGRIHRLKKTTFPYMAVRNEARKEQRLARGKAAEQKTQEALQSLRSSLGNGAARDQAIKIARQKGATLQSLGNELGLSRERIRQIVSNIV